MKAILAASALVLALTLGAVAAVVLHRSTRQTVAHSPTQYEAPIPPAPVAKEPARAPEPVVEPPVVEAPPAEQATVPPAPPVVIAPPAPQPVVRPPAPPVSRPHRPQPAPDTAQAAPPPPRRTAPPVDPNAGAAPEPIIPVATAREALGLVGADPVAEEVWYNAINDPTLSDKVREDLIEDLNEEGFADPKNVTIDELPLIVNRLAIIEQLAPESMDYNNFKSFMEAHKDLTNMFNKLTK